MTSQIGQQIVTRHILPNISRRKDNQAIKFGQLIEKESRRKCGRETSSRPVFVFFKKALYKVKRSGQHFSFNIVW